MVTTAKISSYLAKKLRDLTLEFSQKTPKVKTAGFYQPSLYLTARNRQKPMGRAPVRRRKINKRQRPLFYNPGDNYPGLIYPP
jgi:hypothetical protein